MKEKSNLINIFKDKGYFKVENFFSKNFIDELNIEIQNANNVEKYYDKNNKLRRIEKLYNKGEYLNDLNNQILKYIKDLFNKEFVIFKDKFNSFN